MQAAGQESSVSRDRYAVVHSKAEALRRVAAVRVGEIVQAREAAERRALDDIAILRFATRNAA